MRFDIPKAPYVSHRERLVRSLSNEIVDLGYTLSEAFDPHTFRQKITLSPPGLNSTAVSWCDTWLERHSADPFTMPPIWQDIQDYVYSHTWEGYCQIQGSITLGRKDKTQ